MSDRQEVLGWLPDQDIQEKVHADIMNTTMIENPGKWITALEDFKQWQNSRDSCGIWLHGGLGTGKTVLTSTVVDHLSALYNGTTRGAMAYYYCSGTANAKPTMSDILRSILRQLISTDEGFDKFMNWKIGRERRDLTNESIKKLIGEMIKLNTSQTTIILDALDEADRENSLYVISFLEGLISQDWGLVKVFISSRPEEYIKLALGSWVKIEVSPEATKQDIKTYIDTQVDNFLHLRPTDKVEKKTHKAEEDKLKDDVKAFLNGRANGM